MNSPKNLAPKKFAVLGLVLLFASAAFAAADQYKIDPAHSSINFTVKHMTITNVNGRFTDVSGTIVYDEQDPTKSSVEATVKTASITTDNTSRDKDLRGPDFFSTDKFPEASFKSSKVEKRGDQLVATGTLTIKGVSKQVEVPFEVTKAKTLFGVRIGASATLKINRQDYGINYGKVLDNGGLVVSNDVKLEFNIEAALQPPAK